MTRDETKTILRVLAASYPNFKPNNMAETVDIWTMMLEDMDYKIISMATKAYIRSDSSGFAPSIGELIEYTNKITTPEELTETQAWGLVMKAIRNSAYNSLDEFGKLPEIIQKAVGTPEQLKDMAVDEDFNEQVASSNFMRAYKTVINRKKELQKICPEVQELIENINKGSNKFLLEKRNAERVANHKQKALEPPKENKAVPMPEDAKKRLAEILSIER